MNQERILILEDEAIVADDVLHCLEQAGYRVPLVCNTGEEALHALKSERVDLALIDIMLAGKLDGIETARTLRLRYQVPVIYLTSFTNSAMLERARETTPSGYIVKPFKKRELLATVEMALFPSGSPNISGTPAGAHGTGWTLARTWESWFTRTSNMLYSISNMSPGNAQSGLEKLLLSFKKTAEQWSEVLNASSSSGFPLEELFTLVVGLFSFLHPKHPVRIHCEQKHVPLNCEPLFLIELLLAALVSCANNDPHCSFSLEGGASDSMHETEPRADNGPGFRVQFRVIRNTNEAASQRCELNEWDQSFAPCEHDCTKRGITWASLNGTEEGVSGFTLYFPS